MMIRTFISTAVVGALLATSAAALANTDREGYYGSAKLLRTFQDAKDMDSSSRPGIGSFVPGEEKTNFYNGSVAAGYQYGNGWRTEGEYTFKKKTSFTSGSTAFPTSFNNHNVDSQRMMLNAYRDFSLGNGVSVYGTLGLGIARIASDGWQGTPNRTYGSKTDNNLTYAVGAGVSYSPIDQLSLEFGYRYVDMGEIESGFNNFGNARGLQDEQMKARLVNSEFLLGTRYVF